MAASTLMKRASAFRKKHPSLSMQEAVKKVAAADRAKKPAGKKSAAKKRTAPKKKAAVGRVKRRKATASKKAPAAPKKVKVKIKVGKKGGESIRIGRVKKKSVVKEIKHALGISGIAHSKMGHELQHQHSLTAALNKHRELLKGKGLKATEKAAIRRDIAHYRGAITASKKHVNALKRSL